MNKAKREAEEKYVGSSEDPSKDVNLDPSKDGNLDSTIDEISASDLDSDQSKTNKNKKITCYDNDQELTEKNFLRHLQTDKHLKKERRISI